MADHPRFALVHRTGQGEFVVHRADAYVVIARRTAGWLAKWRRGALTRGQGRCRAWAVGRTVWRLVGPPPDYAASWLEITDAKGHLPT